MPEKPPTIDDIDLSSLPRDTLELMLEAGLEVIDCHRVLAKTGDNVVGELLRDIDGFYEWNHYPPGDVYDGTSHSQYYFHAHPPDERPGEHGHFHTFMRPKGMPPEIKPAPLPDYKPSDDPDDALSHLVAISMDPKGFPVGMFTTNRWVTGEVWYAAEDVIALVDRFEMDLAQPSWVVNRWITAMMRLFRPQITELVRARDRAVAAFQERNPERNPYEDRELEVTSEFRLDIDDQMSRVRATLDA